MTFNILPSRFHCWLFVLGCERHQVFIFQNYKLFDQIYNFQFIVNYKLFLIKKFRTKKEKIIKV